MSIAFPAYGSAGDVPGTGETGRYLGWAGGYLRSPMVRPSSPTGDEVLGGLRPGRVGEAEARVTEAPGDHPPALQDQLGVGAERHRAELEHPPGRREPERGTPAARRA